MSQMVVGLLMVAIGAAGFLFVNRRAFHRRNIAGIEEFDGYARMLATVVVERVIRVISLLSTLGGLSLLFLVGMRG